MKEYPSIFKFGKGPLEIGSYIYAFDKLDGSNIRAEWSKKRGFYKFGSRTQLINESSPTLGESISLIKDKYEKEITDKFKSKTENIVCFFEFFGNSSFAGNHIKDEKHDVVLFDINMQNYGLLKPKEFIEFTKNMHTPKIVYEGNLSKEFENDIWDGKYSVTFEGVVCKSNLRDRHQNIMSAKIKTKAWIEKLRSVCGEDSKKFLELE